jgi:hypothetical protein
MMVAQQDTKAMAALVRAYPKLEIDTEALRVNAVP